MDEKEIRLNAFYDKLTELEELKSNSDLTNKIVEIQRKMESCGDSAPEIEEVNRILTTVSFAFEELFINTYDVLKNSRDEYLATESSLVELWNQIESEKEEEKKAKEQSNSYPYMKFYTTPQNNDISEGNNIDFNWGNINKNNVNNNFEDIMKKYNSVEYKEKGEK